MKRVAFTDVVDIEEVRRMLEAHQQLTGAVSAILDTDENILVAAGWQDLCTKFHRSHPQASLRCRESDAYLKKHLPRDGEHLEYRCRNGLYDVAMPIIIDGQHVATFFTGQFFYSDEEPDLEYFREQAREFGFDEESYLEAVKRAPVFTRDQVRHTMSYFRAVVKMLTDTGVKNLKLAREVEERQQAEAALRRTEGILRGVLSERRRVHEALQESEQRLRTTIQGSPLPIFVLDKDRRIIQWNRALEQLTATSEADLLGTDRAWSAFHDKERPLLADLLAAGKSDEIPYWYGSIYQKSRLIAEAYETTYFSGKLPGGGKWLHFTAAALRDTRGNLIGAVETIEDITDRKVAEEKWHSLYNNLPGGSYTVNEERIIEDVNDVVCAVTGYSRDELVGRPCSVICANAREECHFHHRGVERVDNQEMVLRGKDGRQIPILKSARRIATGNRQIVVENFQDITEQKRLEEQLRHSQKMEAIGQMAGGVAHDFNNILTVILGNANLLQMKTRGDAALERHLDQIVKAADKATYLTHSLLAFSRRHVVCLAPGQVNEIVRKAEGLLCRLIPEDIELRLVTSGDHRVKADSVQIEQVIMNLVTNARDAMPCGGTVTIATEEVELDAETTPLKGEMEAGRYVLISVSDNGTGMPEEMLQRIFEPFFTTKETGKGTGLGLSIVYGIVKQHNGYITVQSRPGEGTTFRIYLPSVPEVEEGTLAEMPVAPPQGTETVLLAEDEPMVRNLTRCVLEESGYTVVEAEDGVDAVEKFVANRERIQLLIFDVIMPRMNGKAAYDRIRELHPEIGALFMSGYTGDYLSSKGGIEESYNFVSKPLTRSILLRKVREALDGRKAA